MPLIVTVLLPSPVDTAPLTKPERIEIVSSPVPEVIEAIEPAPLAIVRLLVPLPRSTPPVRDTPLLLPLTVTVSLPPLRSSCSKELNEKEPVEAESWMVPVLAPVTVTTSSVVAAVPRRMSLPVAPPRFSMLLKLSVPWPVLPPAWVE